MESDSAASSTPEARAPCATLGGLLGEALAANHRGRLSHFVTDESSPPIALFAPEHAAHNREGDWYGEHAGKWLYAAARAAARTADTTLETRVRRVADYLVSLQQPDGYLGNYAPDCRFTNRQERGERTWDGAPGRRTWDIWTHAYLVLGLLETHRHFSSPKYLHAARRIGDLCWRTLAAGDIPITDLGNHHGLSATVLLDPAVELYFATREQRYLDLARLIVRQMGERPELDLVTRALRGADASEIATGKAYQLCWNLVGLAKLYRAAGDARHLQAVLGMWSNIREHHLTLGGGPWGGVALRSREIFNHGSVFSPYGYVETCATLAWMQLNRELLAITGEARFAEEIERSAYNDLLGAQAPDGEDWCYYSFPNGRRIHTTWWRCCKSSGAMALEELPELAYGVRDARDVTIHLYGPSEATAQTAAGDVRIEQHTGYPFDGTVRIRVRSQRPTELGIRLRIPAWGGGATIEVNGKPWRGAIRAGDHARLAQCWQGDDEIVLRLPMSPVLHERASRSVQESRAPDGSPVSQEVLRSDFVAITRGPLVYATTLIDGFKVEESVRLPAGDRRQWLTLVDAPASELGPPIRLHLRDRAPLTFVPYYRAGGRSDGAWRLTWLQLAPVK